MSFTTHTDHSSRPHALIVVKARGESYGGREKAGRQLRRNPADLDAHWFLSLADAAEKLEAWRRDYN